MKIHISFLTLMFGETSGGNRVVANLANQLFDIGYKVTVVSMSSEPPRLNTLNLNPQIRIDFLSTFKERRECAGRISIICNRIKTALSVIRYYKRITEPMLISCIGPSANIIASFLKRPKNLITIGCDHFSFIHTHTGINGLFHKWRYAYLDAIVSLTQEDVSRIRHYNRNVWVIPNSVSFYPHQISSLQNKVIIVAAAHEYYKGLDLLLDIIEDIADEIPEWKCHIAGDGILRNTLENRIRQSEHLSKMVKLLGIVSNIEEEYKNASLFVLTSRSEGLPMVLLEAQSFGLPIVCFNCETGPSDIVHDGKNGYLIPCFDTKLMGERIIQLCKNYPLRQQFGAHARESVKQFLPEPIIDKWEKLINSLILNKL